MQKTIPMVVNGWTLYTHPLFKDQYLNLKSQVEALRKKDPKGYLKKNATKRLAAIHRLIFELIPHDPTSTEFRQGSTLGDDNKHWFRAKFFQQYRLFFRYHLESKVIVYAWVNDEKNKRAYGSKTDAYKVFEKMLNSGHPPEGWEDLLKAAKGELLSPLANHLFFQKGSSLDRISDYFICRHDTMIQSSGVFIRMIRWIRAWKYSLLCKNKRQAPLKIITYSNLK